MIENQRTILVTGAAGFIGSHLVKRLVKDGRAVSVLIKPSSDLWRIKDILPKLRCCYGDLADLQSLEKNIKEINPQGVFHLAASNIRSGVTAPDEMVISANFLGTMNLLKALEGVDYRFFINTSSFLEYGMKEDAVKESDLCEPAELYSITKLAGTLYGQAAARLKDKPIVSLRIFTPFGPFIQPGRLAHQLISRALRNEDINLTQPAVARDFIFVEDLVDLYMEAGEKAAAYRGEVFNAGSGRAVSLGYLVDYTLKITGSRSKVKWNAFPSVSYDSDKWQADMTKTYSYFSWRPAHTIEAGIAKTVDWFANYAKI